MHVSYVLTAWLALVSSFVDVPSTVGDNRPSRLTRSAHLNAYTLILMRLVSKGHSYATRFTMLSIANIKSLKLRDF